MIFLVSENEKNIVVKEGTWLRVGKLKKFPEHSTFDAVLNWLVDKYEEREESKEFL